ncbi:amidohydrolase [Hazenella coriacea]|uniref:Amidohydrolase n=1 Tax=Hazenella coriacea TaxID=1179467 RepID=A0A4R3L5V1_9BACL|nr:amidohydrolase [Hazenella coriacea]
MLYEQIKQDVERIFPQLVAWRRDFHQFPEPSFHEFETAKKVATLLDSFGLEVHTGIGGTGVVGLLRGHHQGPTVALRADLDALPIQDEKQCEYRSMVSNVMHACGHDGHMAMLLGVALLLSQQKEKLHGNVLFIFQHAEEIVPGGAKSIIEAGFLHQVDAIYGIHLWTPLPTGIVGVRIGELMAAADSFRIEVIGKGGHGGLPHHTIDPVIIASHLVVNLQTIVSRQINPLQSGVITVGSIRGGHTFNIIADQCVLEGTVRSFDPHIQKQLADQITQVTRMTCQMFGATYQLDYRWGYPAVINHMSEVERIRRIGLQFYGVEKVWELEPVMAGEDFSYYLQKIPGAFFFIGAGNKEKGITFPHHHPRFDVDEQAFQVGAEMFLGLTLSHLLHT